MPNLHLEADLQGPLPEHPITQCPEFVHVGTGRIREEPKGWILILLRAKGSTTTEPHHPSSTPGVLHLSHSSQEGEFVNSGVPTSRKRWDFTMCTVPQIFIEPVHDLMDRPEVLRPSYLGASFHISKPFMDREDLQSSGKDDGSPVAGPWIRATWSFK